MDDKVIVKLKGESLKFKLASSAIIHLEQHFGSNIFDVFNNPSFTAIVTLLYACLAEEHKSKYTSATDLFDTIMEEYSFQEVSEKILTDIVTKSGLVSKATAATDFAQASIPSGGPKAV